MSETGWSEEVGTQGEQGPSGTVTAGMMLRNAREAAGLHVAALAVSMKIPVKKLEALEADRLDLLHDAVFVRALAASVCRALKIDAAPVLSKLPLNAAPKLNPDERGINAPFHTPGDTAGISLPDLLTKPSAIFVFALVLAGVAVFFIPDFKIPDWSSELATQPTRSLEVAEPSPSPVPAMETQEVINTPVAVPVSMTSAVSPSTAMSVPVSVVTTAPNPPSSAPEVAAPLPKPAASVALQSTPKSSAPVVPVLSTTGLVVFKAKGASWVKVVDTKGIVLLSKTLVEGEVVGVSGATPLSVVVGRVDAMGVEVRGQPFGLFGVAKENVARFEVK
ncbi:MAG: RodZ domain-containing protein [Pseudomonadota bacterium]